jgi:glycosyltransferase involved in cell wall biosynthesis
MYSHPDYKIGGSELQSHYIAQQLSGMGWDVHYITRDYGQPKTIKKEANKVIIHTIPGTGNSLFDRIFENLYALILCIHLRADIYYRRGDGVFNIVAFIAKQILGERMIWHYAHDTTLYPQHKKLSSTIHTRSDRLEKIFSRVDRKAILRSDLIVCQKYEQLERLPKEFSGHSVVLPNMVFRVETETAPLKKYERPTVCWVSNIKEVKQPEVFIWVAEQLPEYDFIMIGSMDEYQDKKGLMVSIARVKNLKYLGKLPYDEVNSIIGKSYILTNTSKAEGFPNAFLQAWVNKVPVISIYADIDGILKNGECGLLSGSKEQMTEDIKHLIENGSIAKKIGENGYNYTVGHFTVRSNIKRYEEVLSGLVKGNF